MTKAVAKSNNKQKKSLIVGKSNKNSDKSLVKEKKSPNKTIAVKLNPGPPKLYTAEFIANEAKELRKFIKSDHGIYIGSFAKERGFSRQRLAEFCKESPLFSDAMEEARQWQEEKFLRMGLTKEWDSAQVRYTMARVCGDMWKTSFDKEEADKEVILNIQINEIKR